MNSRIIVSILLHPLARWSVICVGSLWMAPIQPVAAHPQLMTSVRHRTAIEVSQENVDVVIELTIGEIPAFAERLLMDNNQDGKITASEVEGYLNEQSEALEQAVSLSIAGQPVELLFLYEPEIDLGVEDGASASHLIFRLFYFARLPNGLKTGDEIVLEDRLWSHAPSLGSYQVTGQDGLELMAEKTASTLWSASGDTKPLEMRVRCLAVPLVTNLGVQRDHSESTEAVAPIVEGELPLRASLAAEAVELGDSETKPLQQEPATGRLSAGWLYSIAAIVLVASAMALLTRRTHRLKEEI